MQNFNISLHLSVSPVGIPHYVYQEISGFLNAIGFFLVSSCYNAVLSLAVHVQEGFRDGRSKSRYEAPSKPATCTLSQRPVGCTFCIHMHSFSPTASPHCDGQGRSPGLVLSCCDESWVLHLLCRRHGGAGARNRGTDNRPGQHQSSPGARGGCGTPP